MTGAGLSVVCVNFGRPTGLATPDALPGHYRTLTEWSEALVEAGARVTVVHRFDRRGRCASNGVDYLCSRPGDLHRDVARAGPDVVHVNGLVFPVQTWRLRRALPADVALVIQDHGNYLDGSRPPRPSPRRALLRFGLRAADAFLFSTDAQANGWRRAGLIRGTDRVRAVMEASTRIRAVSRPAASAASGIVGHPAVLWVGRLNANKDPLTVLDAFELALAELPGATLTMVYGDDELRPLVESRRRAPALRERVRLVGRVPAQLMSSFYSAADLFVLGSHHEGSGYALLEACACGTFPVVTSIPSFRAITGDGEIGRLWTPGDARGCARALVTAAQTLDAATPARVVERFERALSWPVVATRALAIYAEVARARGNRRVGASL